MKTIVKTALIVLLGIMFSGSITVADKEQIKSMKDKFRATLSPEQKIQFRKIVVNRGRISRSVFERLI